MKILLKLVLLFSCFSCANQSTADKLVQTTESPDEQHWASGKREGVGTYFIDQIPAERVMKVTDSGNTTFKAFEINFNVATHPNEKKEDLAAGEYYNYQMQYDWTALSRNDSLKPVFFQSYPTLKQGEFKSVIIFEMAADKNIDTLIYQDQKAIWGIQKIIVSK